ncbi:hypothetical protein HHI36_014988 [Cryptolaemus montrouzieri]|uniref:Uncharacterized protein n=1 Tax=Cryptolaemus montrouzieri TaxID=559131 RepID=A0ABD2N4S5_9CUCU
MNRRICVIALSNEGSAKKKKKYKNIVDHFMSQLDIKVTDLFNNFLTSNYLAIVMNKKTKAGYTSDKIHSKSRKRSPEKGLTLEVRRILLCKLTFDSGSPQDNLKPIIIN